MLGDFLKNGWTGWIIIIGIFILMQGILWHCILKDIILSFFKFRHKLSAKKMGPSYLQSGGTEGGWLLLIFLNIFILQRGHNTQKSKVTKVKEFISWYQETVYLTSLKRTKCRWHGCGMCVSKRIQRQKCKTWSCPFWAQIQLPVFFQVNKNTFLETRSSLTPLQPLAQVRVSTLKRKKRRLRKVFFKEWLNKLTFFN